MVCDRCGATGWFKTLICREDRDRRGVLCDPCYEALGGVGRFWIVYGEVNVTSRCDRCQHYCHPRELVTSRPGGGYKRDLVSTGICGACDNGGSRR